MVLVPDNRAMDIQATRRQRLRLLINEHYGGVQAKFLDATGMNQGELSSLLRDKSFGERKARKIEALAGIAAGWLDSLPSNEKTNESGPGHPVPLTYAVDLTKFREIPVIGKAQGGLPDRIWTDGDYPVGVTDQYGILASTDPQAFLVPVVQDSMAPRYNPGEFALIEPGTEPDLEDCVLVRLKSGETMLKRLLSRRDGILRFGSYNRPETLTYRDEEVAWMYYAAHPVPARKIKTRM